MSSASRLVVWFLVGLHFYGACDAAHLADLADRYPISDIRISGYPDIGYPDIRNPSNG